MKPTLFVLAAGMGTRYGGLKQIEALGPNGETIMDYSIYDAIKAGFGKVVFVIRQDFDEEFRRIIVSKYEKHIPVEIVYQGVNKLPDGFTPPSDRTKPWGTNHALMMGEEVINEPFAVINADDFYGSNSFQVLADFLRNIEGKKNQYAMVGYRLGNTLSEGGSVARGVCEVNQEGFLTGVVERTAIQRNQEGIIAFTDEQGQEVYLKEDTPVSMNMWGFTPDYFQHSTEAFKQFLTTNLHTNKSEFYIPSVINNLIQNGTSSCRVLDTTSKWFGVTYNTDKPLVIDKFKELHETGEYPTPLLNF